jgi:1-deoxyxylulose-5-phosphate synthase
MLPLCQDQKMAAIPFSPLARCWLPREPSSEQTDGLVKVRYALEGNTTIAQRVSEVAEARGLPMAQAALVWMPTKPIIITPIVVATRRHPWEDTLAALSIKLTPDEAQKLEEAS